MFLSVGQTTKEFEQFVSEARPRLWRSFLAQRGLDGADDAVAEALAWAWEHQDRLQTMANPIGYLYRVGLTRSIPRPQPINLPAPGEVHLPDIEPSLIGALLRLSAQQRSAVWLAHACGWTYAEVAEALDISRSAVGTHISRALTALRKDFEVDQDA